MSGLRPVTTSFSSVHWPVELQMDRNRPIYRPATTATDSPVAIGPVWSCFGLFPVLWTEP
jgi:hypothetical protein